MLQQLTVSVYFTLAVSRLSCNGWCLLSSDPWSLQGVATGRTGTGSSGQVTQRQPLSPPSSDFYHNQPTEVINHTNPGLDSSPTQGCSPQQRFSCQEKDPHF